MIGASGISEADPRIAHTMAKVKESGKEGDEHLTLDEFTALIRPNLRMMCGCGGAVACAPLPCLRYGATLPGVVLVLCPQLYTTSEAGSCARQQSANALQLRPRRV